MADQYWSNVVLALPMDGAYGSATFTDISPTPKAVTRYGNAQISTAQSKFGGASAYFDGNGDYLTVQASTDFNLGAEDFTVECWARFMATTNSPHAISLTDNSGNYEVRLHLSNGKIACSIYHTSAYQVRIAGTTTLAKDVWYHLALVRSGSLHTLFLSGVTEASISQSHTIPTKSYVAVIGQVIHPAIERWWNINGYIDDLRITKGVARYTANFTPPTQGVSQYVGTTAGLSPSLRFELESVRDGLASLQKWDLSVTRG